jgi:hypothetical protein
MNFKQKLKRYKQELNKLRVKDNNKFSQEEETKNKFLI